MIQGQFCEGDQRPRQKNRQSGGCQNHKEVLLVQYRQKMNEEEEIQLEREIHIMKNIQHPNIVEFYDYFIDPKFIYLILEYLSGGELYD